MAFAQEACCPRQLLGAAPGPSRSKLRTCTPSMPSSLKQRAMPITAFALAFAALGVVGRTPTAGPAVEGDLKPVVSQEPVEAPARTVDSELLTSAKELSQGTAGSPVQESVALLQELAFPVDWESLQIRPAPTVLEVFDDEELDYEPHRIEWGEMLFHDPRLSIQGNLACASCHVQSALGTRWAKIPKNTELKNVFAQFDPHLFWDPDLTELDPEEATTEERIEGIFELLAADERYQVEVDGERAALPLDLEEISELLLGFSLSEVPEPTAFDEYLRGDEGAISLAARQGFELFCRVGCNECHFGWGLGGRAFQKLGREHDYFAARGKVTGEDLGRFNETGDSGDRYLFRVPRLRGMSLEGPYYHDQAQPTLPEAIRNMAYFQLDEELDPRQVEVIVEFLKSLQGRGN